MPWSALRLSVHGRSVGPLAERTLKEIAQRAMGVSHRAYMSPGRWCVQAHGHSVPGSPGSLLRRSGVEAMTRFLSRLADRLRANATIRRKQYIKRWVEKRQQPEMRAGEWFGEPLDAQLRSTRRPSEPSRQ